MIIASKKDNGINLGKIPKMFKIEYLKYVTNGYPFSTIKSKKFTALTVQAIKVRENNMVIRVLKNFYKIILINFFFEAYEFNV